MKIIILTFIFSLILITSTNSAFGDRYSEPMVVFETNQGEIVIEFFVYDAPKHVQNFIVLSSSGYYDGTLFHRIIPGFMIQGGDPNTISGASSTWGQGGPDEKVDAEFNTIKHNRGIVSMARSADPNSAGSQFFIVHQDSNFLDGEYTAFGRLATEESFQTLDKIAAMETNPNDQPIRAFDVKITESMISSGTDIKNLIEFVQPERTESVVTPTSPGNQIFESSELDIAFSAPEGWLLQQPDKSIDGAPDVAAVGPKVNGVNPVISLTIEDIDDRTIDELITEKNNNLAEAVYQNKLEIISQEKIKSNVYETVAIGTFERSDDIIQIKFSEVMIISNQKSYTFAYSNLLENFDNEIERFNESLDSFRILSQGDSIMAEGGPEEGGGCLIATATYGSEMAPQVQQLRELRDNQLLQTESGTQFMGTFNHFYYTFSPIIADYERENPYFKEAVKLAITPMLSSLSIMENAETESEVLGLGLSVIALNLAMYLGVPAIVVIGIKKRN